MADFFKNHFKCSCCPFLNQRITGEYPMHTPWKYHISLIQLMRPKGLHRVVYECESQTDFENDNWVRKVIRNSNRLP